jgi:hypothetical protein
MPPVLTKDVTENIVLNLFFVAVWFSFTYTGYVIHAVIHVIQSQITCFNEGFNVNEKSRKENSQFLYTQLQSDVTYKIFSLIIKIISVYIRDDQNTNSGTVYKQILIDAKLKTRKRGKRKRSE